MLTFCWWAAGQRVSKLAGTLAEIARHTLRKNSATSIRAMRACCCWKRVPGVVDVPDALAARARASLVRRGVDVRAGTPVSRIDADGVLLGEDNRGAHGVVGRGVAASPLCARSMCHWIVGACRGATDLTLPGIRTSSLRVDLSTAATSQRQGRAGVRAAAKQMGAYIAQCCARVSRDAARRRRSVSRLRQPRHDRASRAVVDLHGFRFGVFPVGLLVVAHVFLLIGFRTASSCCSTGRWPY